MWNLRRLPIVAVVFGMTFTATGALATPTFPQAIARHLSTSKIPPCSDCHDGATTRGTATSAFAAAMRARGLLPNDESSLNSALDAMAAEQVDSDGDGFSDVEELVRGWDPNLANQADGSIVPGATRAHALVPSYGCAVVSAPRRAAEPSRGVALLAAVLGLVALRRSRSRRRMRTRLHGVLAPRPD